MSGSVSGSGCNSPGRLGRRILTPSSESDAHAIYLECSQAIDAVLNRLFIAPPQKPVGCRSIEEIVLTGPLPNETPRVSRVNADRTFPMLIRCCEVAGLIFCRAASFQRNMKRVRARLGRHESDAVKTSVGRIAKPHDKHFLWGTGGFKIAGERCIRKRVDR